MARITWTPQAVDDLDDACAYVSKHSKQAARRLSLRIRKALERLRLFPQSGRMVPERMEPNIREIIVSQYRIVYRVWDDEVEIVTVHHGAKPLDDTLL